MPELRRVVPLHADLGTVAGHRLLLLSAEVWDDWFDLRFARVDVDAERTLPRRVPPAEAWTVSDGEGRRYTVLDAVGRGDRSFTNGEVRLAPSLADDADRLLVEVRLLPGAAPLTGTVALGQPR